MVSSRRRRFAEGVTATFETIRHLYRAVDRLNLDLRDALQNPPTPFRTVGGTWVGKTKDRDDERQIIRAWYGRVHAPGLSQDSEPEEDVEEDSDDDGAPSRRRRRPPIAIESGDRLLATKVVLYEPSNTRFEPVIRYAVIGGWALSGK